MYGVAIVAAVALWFVLMSGRSTQDIQNQPDTAAYKAAADTAKSESLFKTTNPLSGVKADPFEKTKKVLNPFEN